MPSALLRAQPMFVAIRSDFPRKRNPRPPPWRRVPAQPAPDAAACGVLDPTLTPPAPSRRSAAVLCVEGSNAAPCVQSIGPDPHERVLVREPDPVLVEGQDVGRHAVECDVARHGQAVDLTVCCSIDRQQWSSVSAQTSPFGATAMWSAPVAAAQFGRDAVGDRVDAPDEPLVRLRDPDRVRRGRQVAGVAAQCDLARRRRFRDRRAGPRVCRSG